MWQVKLQRNIGQVRREDGKTTLGCIRSEITVPLAHFSQVPKHAALCDAARTVVDELYPGWVSVAFIPPTTVSKDAQ